MKNLIFANKNKVLYALSLMIAVVLSLEVQAEPRQCPKCHGSGWQVTIPDVGHFGVERTKRKCPVCGEMVYSGHRDKCTQCGGSGQIDNGRSSSDNDFAEDRAAEGEAFFVQYLTPEENQNRQNLMQALMATKFVVETCTVCQGSKKCSQCGGVQNLSIDADVTTLCRVCGGSGLCVACNGQGTISEHQELAYSQEERDKIARNCGVYSRLANIRCSNGISPDDPDGPRIAIDSDGNYYIENEHGGDGTEEIASADNDEDSSMPVFKHSKKNKTKRIMVTFGVIIASLVGAGVYLKRRKRVKP